MWLTFLLVLGGSFGLTIFALSVRWAITGQDIASLSDLVLATAAYQVSVLWDARLLQIFISNPDIRNIASLFPYFFLTASLALFGLCLYSGERLWVIRDHPDFSKEEKDYCYEQGFIIGWIFPVVWSSYHLAAMFF